MRMGTVLAGIGTTRSIAENSEAGTAVGAPVAATDPGPDGRQENPDLCPVGHQTPTPST